MTIPAPLNERDFSQYVAFHDSLPEETRYRLQSDWLDGLAATRLPLGWSKDQFGILVAGMQLRYGNESPFLGKAVRFNFRPETKLQPRRAWVWINPTIQTWSRVERIELLVYASLRAFLWIRHEQPHDDSPQLATLTRSMGVAMTTSGSPMERWRRIFFRNSDRSSEIEGSRIELTSAIAALFEDRPTCVICHRGIATDATAFNGTRAHEECRDYAKAVLLPALKAQRAAQKAEDNRD